MSSIHKIRSTAGVIVVIVAVVSSLVFLSQGGFGGGHGKFDRLIYMLGLPWDWVLSHAPLPQWSKWLLEYDLVWLVVVPFMINICLVLAASFLTSSIGSSPDDGPKNRKLSS
jgi:hypothetical protein